MRKIFSILFIVILAFGMLMKDADAARFGGGRSFGMQRSVSSFSSRTPGPSRFNQPSTGNKWLGPLAGFALGGLLTSLFMGHGFGSGILSWLMIISVGLMIWSFLRNRFQGSMQSSSANQYRENYSNNVTSINNNFVPLSNVTPAGFDATSFLREAKVQFIRLQAAYDSKNLNDIREFTSPEVFAEIQLQLQERGNAENQTEVVSLEAELIDVDSVSQNASVDFSGMIKENPSEAAANFKEIWHFQKDMAKNKWIITGVQQH